MVFPVVVPVLGFSSSRDRCELRAAVCCDDPEAIEFRSEAIDWRSLLNVASRPEVVALAVVADAPVLLDSAVLPDVPVLPEAAVPPPAEPVKVAIRDCRSENNCD